MGRFHDSMTTHPSVAPLRRDAGVLMLNTRFNPINSAADFRELDCVATLLRSERASICQLEPGRLYAAHESLALGRLHFVRVKFSHSVRLGVDRMNGSYLVVRSDLGDAPRIAGTEIPPGAVALCHGNQKSQARNPFELVIPASVSVSFVELANELMDAIAPAPEGVGATPSVTILPDGARELYEIIEQSFEYATDSADGTPGSTDARAIESRVLDVVLRQMAPREPACGFRASSSTRAVSLIETLVTNYLETHEPISIVEMCRVTGLSRRALTYAFQKRYGVPPKRFFRNLALNAVRHDLINSRGSARVSDIAPFYGFWHMSQFAADYRYQFGELPSETLARARWEGARQPNIHAPGIRPKAE